MSELTAKKRNSVIAMVVVMTSFMLGFHYEALVKGVLTDYSFEPLEGINQCGPSCLKEYMGSYQALR